MRSTGPVAIAVAFTLVLGPARADEPPGERPEIAAVAASQITVIVPEASGRRLFRATALARAGGSLTILTGAHCLGPADAGRPARLLSGGVALEASVVGVVRNPSFGAQPGVDIPGADNAVAHLRVEAPGDRAPAFEAIRPAPELADRPVPRLAGETLSVWAFDQAGRVHPVRAGNYSNPRWLEWGAAYRPVPGDSGGGVFALRRDAEGRQHPVLVGVVVDRSILGGGASLLSRQSPWLARALAP